MLVVVVVFVIEDYINGEKVGEVVKWSSVDGDLFTRNIILLFYHVFARLARGDSTGLVARDDTGTERIFIIKGDMGSGVHNLFNTYNCATGVSIRFGSGSSPPSRDDYRLLFELVRVSASLSYDVSNYVITISGSWTPNINVSLCEVGLYIRACDRYGYARFLLLDRSVLSPCRSVSAGETVSASYVFRF